MILVTGATGFFGSALIDQLVYLNCYQISACSRSLYDSASASVINVPITEEFYAYDWSTALTETRVVIHAAGLTHMMKDEVSNPLSEFRRVNVDGTLNLARQAAAAGVKRFIFMSSIKVSGEQSPFGRPFTIDDTPAPVDAYAISKWEAEQGLRKLAAETGMEFVIIRPPLVYGPGVKGNFATLIKLVANGLPLPFGGLHNQRSLVSVDNLVDLTIKCIDHPAAANKLFLAGDGHDLSTTELLRGVACAMGKPSRLVSVPSSILMLAATLLGKRPVAQRLIGSLQVDISKAREVLAWEPPISVEEGLRRCFAENTERH